MDIKNLKRIQELASQYNDKKHELRQIEDVIQNASGNTTVKINTRWIIGIPSVALRGHAQVRKLQLEKEITDIENELLNL